MRRSSGSVWTLSDPKASRFEELLLWAGCTKDFFILAAVGGWPCYRKHGDSLHARSHAGHAHDQRCCGMSNGRLAASEQA
mmetsp:Transcript_40694/g.93527  ORF Transcript_40694/g.93527 Transcript_40694/m.93527 type:complete len:80 (+) Transcript_40694:1403-1642(+)